MRATVLLLVPLLLVGCGGGGGAGTSTFSIEMKSTGASPGSLSVPSGAQVSFVNHDTADHQIGSGNCSELISGRLSPSSSFTAILGTGPKACNFNDSLNPSATNFQGTLNVAAPTGPGH